MKTLASASLELMWLLATHLYVPLSLSLTWAMSILPSFVVSAPGGRLSPSPRLHSNRMGWEPWARHWTCSASPAWSLTWSGRQVAYGGPEGENITFITSSNNLDIHLFLFEKIILHPRLTLHLHLRVRFTVAVYVGGIADVLAWILAPHAGQCQNSTSRCVFPRQRCSQLGPGDGRRRGTWNEG